MYVTDLGVCTLMWKCANKQTQIMVTLPPCRYVFLAVVIGCLLVVPTNSSEISYSIKEELTPGTIFGYIVDDSDLRRKVSPDELGNLMFSFLKTGNPYSKYFGIEPKTGVLSVASRIDRETVCSFRPECILTVSAAVQSELGPFFLLIQVHVQVTDVNDNPPTFSQDEFQLTIFENAALGVTFPLPTAYDKDTGVNNTVRDYFLLSGYPTFSLQTTEDDVGNIQTALQLQTNLNREETSHLTVLVGARDGGKPPLTGTLTVMVTVADVNDNYPVFDQYAYNVNVSETTRTDEPLVRVHAVDADIGINGNITYRFSQQQPRDVLDLFRMNSLSGNMFLTRSAENHTGRIYELVVEASDQGLPPKVSRALVRVSVLDTVNSRPDVFVDILSAANNGQAEVSEYAEVGKVVAYVSVRDPDSGENGVTVCSLNTKDFELQPLNNQGQYKVILVTNLDREKIWRYDISVVCTDFGVQPLENSENFVVIVRDENDNPPVFSQRKYVTTIPENQTVGATIVQLTVTDLDIGRNAEVEYKVAGAYQNEFKILDNGTMIATAPLDRELSEKLVVKVMAVDKGFPPLSGSATVFVTLEDVNDQAPTFNEKQYSFSVAEDARVGSYVGIVGADDADQGLNAEITFMELPGTTPPAFIITKEGVVKTNMPLDREEIPVHYFPVVARDGGTPPLSSTTTLTIHVDDVNDNTPIFIYPTEGNDTISIPHTYPVRTPITRVAAKDLDMGPNQQLVYSCASANDTGRLFGVDERTGDLFLHRYLSGSQAGTYVLRVAAHDEGTPQLSNQTLLYVEVYFDNSTLLDASHAAAPSKAVLTAIILVGVVVVVGGVAVTTLLCIRRAEAKKKAENNNPLPQSPSKLQGGYYIAPGVCESPAFGGGLSSSGALGKPIPEQSGQGGDMAGDVSNMRTANPYVIMPPHSNYSDADGPAEIIEIPRNGMFHRIPDAYPEDSDRADDSHFSTFRSQDGALSPGFRQNSLNRRQSEDVADDKQHGADDTLSLSELSCQSTSDSGRGGSEFDVNNAANKERGAGTQATSSPLPNKGANSSFRPRDPDVTFTTFRGESPCSFRFGESDNDTLTRSHHHHGNPRGTSPLPLSSSHHLQPHARSLHSVAGAAAPSVFRPQHVDSTSSDEASSLGRRNSGARRAITPSADISRYGYGNAGWFNFNHAPTGHVERGGGGGGDGSGYYGGPGRTFPGVAASTFNPSGHGHMPTYSNHNGVVPPVEFRGRNNLGHVPSNRRHVPDYVNAYSDLDSGDDTRNGGEAEPTEDDFLLPPYPEVVEEEGEGLEVSERSALNFVPGHANFSGNSGRPDDSYVIRHQSEV